MNPICPYQTGYGSSELTIAYTGIPQTKVMFHGLLLTKNCRHQRYFEAILHFCVSLNYFINIQVENAASRLQKGLPVEKINSAADAEDIAEPVPKKSRINVR